MKNINEILDRKRHGADCTEYESAELKGWLKSTTILPNSGDQQILEDIQLLFPIEYGEAFDEMSQAAQASFEKIFLTIKK